jgi:hypothetical protein
MNSRRTIIAAVFAFNLGAVPLVFGGSEEEGASTEHKAHTAQGEYGHGGSKKEATAEETKKATTSDKGAAASHHQEGQVEHEEGQVEHEGSHAEGGEEGSH